MCNCINEIEELLLEKMCDEYKESEGWEVIDAPTIQNRTLLFNSLENGTCEILKNEVVGKVRNGKKVQKFKTYVMPEYCCYCGEKL